MISRDCHTANTILNGDTDTNLGRLLNSCTARLQAYKDFDPRLANTVKLLDEALIQVEEAQSDLESYISGLDLNPERLNYLEMRLQNIHDLARKHKIPPEELNNKLKLLKEELDSIQHADAKLAELSIVLLKFEQAYHLAAEHLSSSRKQAADLLNTSVSKNIQLLGMSGGKFEVQLTPRTGLHIKGQESIEFFVSANPGQPLRPIAKVASGGELSRMSLAIEVITADHTNTPTLIFDEVDVGIGGATAEIVGKLLRELGNKAQVFCITHLAQVAAQAHHHLQVSKTTDGQATHTDISYLNAEERIQEIARMLGGVKISAKSLAHAKELLTEID